MAYPYSAPAADKTDNKATPTDHPGHHNALANALIDLLAELGSNPSGAAADLTARLAAIDTALAGLQPLDSDLTAIAALTTTSYGRAFLALADAAAGRSALGLGTAATQASTAFDAAGAAASAQSASQPLDSDLTAIAALTTTSYGRAFLALADAAAARSAIAAVSDTAYDATSWNGVTDIAPSQNAVRDKIEAVVGASVLLAGGTMTGELATPDIKVLGTASGWANLVAARFLGMLNHSGPPIAADGTGVVGDYVIDSIGVIYICTGAGTPGTWVDPTSSKEIAYSENITGSAVTVTGTGSANGTLTDITGVSISVPATTRPVYLEAAFSGSQITNAVAGTGAIFIAETTGATTTIMSRAVRLPGSITTRENSFSIRVKVRIGPVASTRTFKLQARADSSTATAAIFNVVTLSTLQPYLAAFAA